MSEDYLQHFGVKGMKWGVRKKEETSGRHSAKNAKKTEDKTPLSETPAPKKHGLTKKQKYLIAAGAALAIGYTAYRLNESGDFNRLALQGKAFLDGRKKTELFKRNDKFTKEILTDVDLAELHMRINPGYGDGQPGAYSNCRRCTFTYEMSRRGYDVEATKTHRGSGQNYAGFRNATVVRTHETRGLGPKTSAQLELIRLDKETNNLKRELSSHFIGLDNKVAALKARGVTEHAPATAIINHIASHPKGARGELNLTWKTGGAHSVAWEMFGNTPHIMDLQTGQVFKNAKEFSEYADNVEKFGVNRLDNINLNKNFLAKWMK